jgi:hypothetical protein
MSDIFDHNLDAIDDYYNRGGTEFFSSIYKRRRIKTSKHYNNKFEPFVRDQFFYHKKVYFEKIVVETNLSYLVKFFDSQEGIWIPKKSSQIFDLHTNKPYAMVHKYCMTKTIISVA